MWPCHRRKAAWLISLFLYTNKLKCRKIEMNGRLLYQPHHWVFYKCCNQSQTCISSCDPTVTNGVAVLCLLQMMSIYSWQESTYWWWLHICNNLHLLWWISINQWQFSVSTVNQWHCESSHSPYISYHRVVSLIAVMNETCQFQWQDSMLHVSPILYKLLKIFHLSILNSTGSCQSRKAC